MFNVCRDLFNSQLPDSKQTLGKRWCQYRRERPGIESFPSPYSSNQSTPTRQRDASVQQHLNAVTNARPYNNAINHRYSDERKHDGGGETPPGAQNSIDNTNKSSPSNSQNR